MPLFSEALALIRANLEELKKGNRVSLVAIGAFTEAQLEAINHERGIASARWPTEAPRYPPMGAEVVFLGRHVYESRVVRDGYTIDDVVEQIASAMDSAAVVLKIPKMTAMENPSPRADRYGNSVRDRVCFRVFISTSKGGALFCHSKGRRHKTKKAVHVNERPFSNFPRDSLG
jgi:hypothetical protein